MFALFITLLLALSGTDAATDTTYSANFIMTYPQMPNAGVSGLLIYDLSQRSLAFRFTATNSSEIYKWNQNLGYRSAGSVGQYEQQYVWKVVPNSACSPCAQYSNTKGFPFTNNSFDGGWASSVLVPPAIKGGFSGNVAGTVDARGCTRYDSPGESWATYFGIKGNELCYLADSSGRLFTIVEGSVQSSYDSRLIEPPTGCKCLLPVDIAVSLDRSSSIITRDTYYYTAFMKSFANSFYFNSSDPTNTAQLSITQWGGALWPLTSIGNLNFTSNYDNIKTASGVIGCTSRASDCKFCYNCDNKKREEDAQGQGSCSNPKKPDRNSTRCTFGESTCTACGIYGMTDQFARSTYLNRPSATKIAIVITDGRSNTPYPGNPTYVQGDCKRDSDQPRTRTQEIGCYLDITLARQNLLAKVPGVITYAIGVGGDYAGTTLDRISGSSDRSFNVSTFEDLLANLQKFVLGFCALPNPTTECGSCCGFCQCGQCLPPDVPIPSAFCDENNYALSEGNCFIKPVKKTNPPCPTQNCRTSLCSNATSSCSYTDNCAPGQPGINECFEYQCARNITTGFYSCQPSLYLCAPNTTRPPTNAPTTSAPIDLTIPTKAPTPSTPCSQGCGSFGSCNPDGSCLCTNNYTGVLCGIPPEVDVCRNDTECFVNLCVESRCVMGPTGGRICLSEGKNCDDGLRCTLDSCDPTLGCLHVRKFCDDGLQCTDDVCNESTGQCTYSEPDCSHLEDGCHTGYCDNYVENVSQRCQQKLIECERDGNCSIAECREGEGCVNEVYSCGVAYYGAIAIAGGVIAGIVIAAGACILIAAMTAGGGYAVSRNFNVDQESHVHVSPLYKSPTKINVALG